ncbi:BREX-1 system adenine-specific DNA-methyltransferase PglX [Methanospirillum sp.]
MVDTKSNNPVPNFYRASAEDFKKIPGSPIAYWVGKKIIGLFVTSKTLSDIGQTRRGLQTGDSEKFIRKWFEVESKKISNSQSQFSKLNLNFKWFLFNSGGLYRKWYGNIEDVVNWQNNGQDIKATGKAIIPSEKLYFKQAITWPKISSGKCSFRIYFDGIIPGDAGPFFINDSNKYFEILCFVNSKISVRILEILSPTLNFEVGVMGKIPIIEIKQKNLNEIGGKFIDLSKTDWDSYETSWDFTTLPLISPDYLSTTIEASYQKLRSHWQEMTTEMKELEEENNKIFIEAYGLQDELTPDVPLSEITLTCNPHYRYDANKPEEELEALLRTDTIKELISYAVGCMVGRYSLDTPGLILANQGETVDDYLKQIPEPSFKPDDDNIIPVLDDEYFPDDIVGRFKNFLKTVFGEKTLSQNLDSVAQALTGKSTSSPEKVIRDYFLKDFFKDHVQRYKKRPIYWMFSSGKQQGFNALVYMHRYNKTTLAKMRTDYLLELEAKLDAELNALNEDPVKNKARISKIKKQVDEMKTWDELLNNKALSLIEIDLDDGVVVNYAKFEGLVRAI